MIKMKQIYQRFFQNALLLAIIIPSILLSQDPPEGGCTDEAACNYDENAVVDDDSCEFESDCFGECGGSAIVDDCGVCDGGNVDMDCAGICNGTAVEDCTGACNGDATTDVCGVCEGNGATNGLCPNGTPVLFQIDQSTLQAFYFFTDVTLDGEPIGSDDWVAAFNGDICVGARQWDTSICGGGLCEVPAMGDDGSEYVIGYMQVGDIPTFKIYDASTGNVINAIPSLDVDPWSINGFSMNELLEAVIGCSDNTACNYNPNATESCSDCCTYIEEGECDCEGNIDLGCGCGEDAPSGCDNNCGSILENDACGECGGDNSTCSDCAGAPNGDALEDMCGVCDNDVSNDCEQDCAGDWGGAALEDMCETCDSDASNDCVQDCAGDWGGDALYDNCEECVLPNDDSCPIDCAGVEGGEAFINQCGTCICNGSEAANGFDCIEVDDCTQDCNGEWGGIAELDDCGLCNGESICDGQMLQGQCMSDDFNVGEFNVSGFDCNGFCLGTICFGDSTDCYGEEGADECYDCAGTPNSDAPAELDDCGICSGGDSEHIANSDQDCTGECFGNSVLDDCEICFGENDDMSEFGLSCYIGCTDENASNYYCDDDVNSCVSDQPPEGFIDDGTCTYNIEGTIEYYSNETAIEDVLVTIYGSSLGSESDSAIDTAITDSMGHFIIPHVPIRNTDDDDNAYLYEHYYFKYSYSEDSPPPVGDVQAELIVKVVVGIESFPTFLSDNEYTDGYHSSIAADVDLNDHINAFDATLIRRFESGASSSLNELDIRWKFVSEIDTIYDITNLTDYNNFLIHGVKLGDPHGYWEGE